MDAVIKVNDKEFRRRMKGFEKQIPFAMSKALNATARDAVEVTKARLDDDFTIRSRWVQKGIRANFSNKRNLVATVGSVDEFMQDQATGGTRKDGAVPMVGRGLPRPKITSPTRRAKWPGSLLEKRNAFIGDPFDSGVEGLWQRIMKGRGKSRKAGLRLLYTFEDEVQIPARWPLQDHVEEVVQERWADHTISAIQEAIDTAR